MRRTTAYHEIILGCPGVARQPDDVTVENSPPDGPEVDIVYGKSVARSASVSLVICSE